MWLSKGWEPVAWVVMAVAMIGTAWFLAVLVTTLADLFG